MLTPRVAVTEPCALPSARLLLLPPRAVTSNCRVVSTAGGCVGAVASQTVVSFVYVVCELPTNVDPASVTVAEEIAYVEVSVPVNDSQRPEPA